MTRESLTRWGLWALPLGGVLTFIPWLGLYFSKNPDPVKDPGGMAQEATSAGVIVLGDAYMIGTLCLLFGLLALYSVLAETSAGTWAAAGAIGGVVAMMLVIGVWMILVVGGAIVGDVVLSGHRDAGATYQWMSGGHWNGRIVPVLTLLGVSGIVGAVGQGVAIWRSGRFPRWIS